MSELALKRIAENKAKYERGEDARVLDLSNCNLTSLPDDLKDCVWIEELIINFNRELENINNILSLQKLIHLEVSYTKIKNLTVISELSNLQLLDLSKNQIYQLPNFDKLQKLKELYVYSTWINDLSEISNLKNLKELYCGYTEINSLQFVDGLANLEILSFPKTKVESLQPLELINNLIGLEFPFTSVDNLIYLRNMYKLISLNFSSTKVYDISVLSQFNNLQFLRCSDNHIKDLTPVKWLRNLQYLNCSNNPISDISSIIELSNLKYLNCSNGDFNDLSPIFPIVKRWQLSNWSKDFHLAIKPSYETVIINPPPEIIEKGVDEFINYFEELERAKKNGLTIKLSEAKCLILGEGGAGKTSLAKKLLNAENELPEELATTKGIDVYPYDLKLNDGTDFRLNIWDFGGQEIYHATHQFFLTKRSIYILLDDTRTSDKTVNDASFNYWLQIAELYGGNSPLLIVQNEKGDRSKQLDLRGMQGRFGFVKDAKATNLLTCRGLDEVWAAIEYWLQQLPHIGEEQPKAWVDIRRELERLAREEGRDHIPLEEYYRICAQHDIPERERALFLSSYLHDFGAFLHFQDHPLLRKTLVLNNQWATDAVYKVLDCEEVKGNFGRFTRSTLGRIWADDRYADQHAELLALMEKFELCYKLPDERTDTWLAPQLLSVLQPDALVWDEADNLQIRYEYEFMPKGLLSQHIVRMHRYIRQTELAWKSGAVFERASSQALVTEAWGSRNIRIRARGAQAKELLTLLSEDFDKMHERLEGLKVRKMIPCICPKCAKTAEPHFYDHEKLQRRKMDGKRTVECDMSYEDVSVVGLLDGVFAKHIPIDPIENQSLKSLENMKKIFISYSKSDKAHLDDFKKQLSPLRRSNAMETWDDSHIQPGEEWDMAIKRELKAADIIVLLISADLINTDYIWDVEMKAAMERHDRGEATVIPVIIRACIWEKAPFGKLNALPTKGVPVEKWANRDEAWTEVVKRIEQVL